MHGQIQAYADKSHKYPISAKAYEHYMEEAQQWDKRFRPSNLKGTVPLSFNGSLCILASSHHYQWSKSVGPCAVHLMFHMCTACHH